MTDHIGENDLTIDTLLQEVTTMARRFAALWLVLLTVALVGCAQIQEETPAPDLEMPYVPVVSVTGEVVPAVWAELSAQAGGMVTEVSVGRGDSVAAGDGLVRLETADLERAVSEAELGVRQAEESLRQAELSLRQAELRLVQLQEPPEERDVEAAERALTDAKLAYQEAKMNQSIVDHSISVGEEAEPARFAKDEAYRRYQTLLSRKGAEETITEAARMDYLEALGKYNRIIENNELDSTSARNAVTRAYNAIQDAEKALADVLEEASGKDVEAAQLDIETAEKGIDTAKLEIETAEFRLETAQSDLEEAVLTAPFSGTAGAVDVRVGEMIVPGEPVITLGDLTTLRVETTDLDEIDVARVVVGQTADVTFDALPERVFTGRVTHISPMAEPGTGGVNYTVVIELDEIAPAIRWGMTAFVDIEVK